MRCIDNQTIKNPFIIIVGICDYSNAPKNGNKREWRDLDGVFIDVKNMYYLWNDIYNYNKNNKSIKIVCNYNDNENDSKEMESNPENAVVTNQFEAESEKILNDKQEFLDFLGECRGVITYEKRHDSLINFIFRADLIKR